MKNNKIVRLAKFLAEAGVASRRKAEEIIKNGQVKIDNQVINNVATKVSIDAQNILVNDKQIFLEEKVYYLLNKPLGYICSVKDPHNSQTVLSLVPKQPTVFPVGRLDKNSQGLILLTNDGDLAYKLTHPKFEVQKIYLVKVQKTLDKNIVALLKQGVQLDEGLAKADQAKIISNNELEITLHQGWKRQIRRMIQELNHHVVSLTRVAEGKLKLGNLEVGKYKVLNKQDIL